VHLCSYEFQTDFGPMLHPNWVTKPTIDWLCIISRAIALPLTSERINWELNDSDVSEVTEYCLSNASKEADLTTGNRDTNGRLQLSLQLALFKVPVRTQSLTYNVCNHHSVCIQCLLLLLLSNMKITSAK